MEFGVVLQTNPPARHVVELAQLAESCGFDSVWTYDSCVLWQEPFVIYPQILSATERVTVGPMVTNPLTRDWSVTASLFATLNEMFGNRTRCSIGRGDSAVRVVGRKPASLADLLAASEVIRALAEGREAVYNGTTVRLPWVRNSKLPMWLAGLGPRALDAIGENADGVVLGVADLRFVRWAVSRVRAAAERACRDPARITVCLAAPAYVGADLAHQRDELRWYGAMAGNHVAELVARYGPGGEGLPDSLTAYVDGRGEYDYAYHGRVDNPFVDFVPDGVIEDFCILGQADQHVERLRSLCDAGVGHFALQLMHDAKQATLTAYRDVVIPALRTCLPQTGTDTSPTLGP